MKQTAIDWLIEQLKENNMLTFDEWKELFKQAKEMEKEQMKALYTMHMVDTRTMELYDFEQYYNETFKSV